MKTSILLLVGTCLLMSGCTQRPEQKEAVTDHNTMQHSAMDHSKMVSSPGASDAPYELQFIDTMIMHHQGAIDAAQLVATRAQHEELRQLAQAIITDQQSEIAQMRNWRSQWFDDKGPAINMDLPGMREGMQGMDNEKLDLLKENAFDLEFIRQMIPHHEGAIIMAKDLLPKDVHPETRTLAQNMIRSQTAEIEQMRGWQAEWSKK